MFYHLLYPLRDYWSALNVFKYITFRSIGCGITSFIICVCLGNFIIRKLSLLGAHGTTEREHAPELHSLYNHKKHVPTMGGILILLAVVVSNALWGNFASKYTSLSLLVILWLGIVGFLDDYIKVITRTSKGIPARIKLIGQAILGIILSFYLYSDPTYETALYIPFVKDCVLPLGLLFIPFSVIMIVGASNALNITDGVDGLAIGCAIIVAGTFAIISYVSGHYTFANYLNVPFFRQSGELTVFCLSLVGAGVGFLWFNAYPATVFMGDTGSLALGGAIGAVALFIKKELLLLIVGGVFVWEALSVIMQVVSYKFRGKRIFRCAPFHHHLQLNEWHEAKVTTRLLIVAFILALIGLSSLKLQ